MARGIHLQKVGSVCRFFFKKALTLNEIDLLKINKYINLDNGECTTVCGRRKSIAQKATFTAKVVNIVQINKEIK